MAKILIGKYEATIYPEGDGFTGAISLGFGPDGKRQRLKRKARTKTLVKDKLIKAVKDLEAGVSASETYTVRDAVNDLYRFELRRHKSAGLRACNAQRVFKLGGIEPI